MVYLLDTNVFIQAQRLHYPRDVVPGFWASLSSLAEAGTVGSIESVRAELQRGSDELSIWAAEQQTFFSPNDDEATQIAFGTVAEALHHRQPAFIERAFATFLGGADPWLVAAALATGAVVVTQELASPARTNAIKIPDVCALVGVTCISTIELLRTVGVRLVKG